MNKKSAVQPQPANAPAEKRKLPRGPIVYVAVGDSTGVGVGARNGGYVDRLARNLVAARPGSKLINLCVSGAATPELLRTQLKRAIDSNPDLITVGIGINDLGHGISLPEFAENFEMILNDLSSKTKALIVVTNIPDISSSIRVPTTIRPQLKETITQYNRVLEEISNRHGAIVFDVFTITHQELPQHPEYFSADGFHPSDKGYELWSEQMWPSIENLLD